jgi:5-methylcytosine-specific restriction endonuclease McrA
LVKEKYCAGCDKVKSYSEFGVCRRNTTGIQSRCLECQAAYQKNRWARMTQEERNMEYAKNRDRQLQYYKDRRLKMTECDYERERAQDRALYWANPEKFLTKDRVYYHENREKSISRVRRWQKCNPDKVKIYSQLAYHRRHAHGGINFDDIRYLIESQPLCPYCNDLLTEDNRSIDHIVPVVKGGTNDLYNLTLCCKPCNSSKNKKTLLYWLNIRSDAITR